MAQAVAAQLDVGRLPSAERFRRGRQARVDAEVVEQAIDIEREQVLLVTKHRVAERPVEQPDVGQVERLRLRGDLVRDLRCRHGEKLPAFALRTLGAQSG